MVGLQTALAILEISIENSQKAKKKSTIQPIYNHSWACAQRIQYASILQKLHQLCLFKLYSQQLGNRGEQKQKPYMSFN